MSHIFFVLFYKIIGIFFKFVALNIIKDENQLKFSD